MLYGCEVAIKKLLKPMQTKRWHFPPHVQKIQLIPSLSLSLSLSLLFFLFCSVDAKRAYRELAILHALRYGAEENHIISLVDAFTPNSSPEAFTEMYLCFDLAPGTLALLIGGLAEEV